MSISTRAAYLINSMISCAAASTSEYPMQATKARKRLEALKIELEEHVSKLENPAVELFIEPREA